jgi:glutaconyl-CoA/methylmalonyl-CoA decarboxylase subunit gamma
MQVTVDRAGKKERVEIAADLSSVEVGGRTFPVNVVASSATRVELEIAGERIVVDNWPEHFATPPGPVDVDGERWNVGVVTGLGAPARVAKASGPPPLIAPTPSSEIPASSGEGVAVLPPMPGRVIELRVKEGGFVRKGDVLLVLEAMKMRNEIVSPAEGLVRDLRVSAGTNVRAKEPMLFIAPGPAT